ncbi:unnamed protein product [Phytophthora fragariaefolia]|uniref:Unnamed protein product n=1 Tax=Phytophthora fragariaefolia TaxID=1490495 RepID=A0A9W6U215_9STRA|nr:unnamed protein product [Phytophthora fragariaefolia]
MMGATTRSPGPPQRTPPNLLQEVYLDKLVAFSPEKGPWMKSKRYRSVGTASIVGRLCRRPLRGKYDVLDVEGDADHQVMEDYEAFDPGVLLPTSFEEIEAIENMRFEPGRKIEEPGALFEHQDGSTYTRLRPEYSHVFEHSATSRFFAYLPIFLGILFYMALNKKGEYANYWGSQPEDLVFGGSSTSLDAIMPLSQFKLLRRCFSFNAVPTTLEYDAAARIRPLLNLLKYQFHLYVVCCSSTWIALNYKLHCSRCDAAARLDGIVGFEETRALREGFDQVSKIRQHVLEVMRPFYATNRIVNMDNYYTSVQLLEELERKGLYGRGTIRANSKHFPRHTILDESKCTRGDSLQAISIDYSMIAASWCDGDVVNILTNADPSATFTVTRMIGSESREYPAPTCLGEYNKNKAWTGWIKFVVDFRLQTDILLNDGIKTLP